MKLPDPLGIALAVAVPAVVLASLVFVFVRFA